MEQELKKQYYPTVKQSFGLILKLVLVSIPVGLVCALLGEIFKYIGIDKDLIDQIIFLLVYVTIFIWIAKIGLNDFRKTNLSDYRLKFARVPVKLLGLALLILFPGIFIIEPLVNLIPMSDSFNDYMLKMIQPNIFSFLSVVIAAPILEEILFRGIVLEGLLKNYSPWKAILWSSVIFGLGHLNPWQAIGATMIGILIGWVYQKTDSLIPGIMIHFTNNLFGFIFVFTVDSNVDSFYQLINNGLVFGIVYLFAIGICISGIYLLNRQFAKA